jgi:MFS transporter, DHA1 family, multidrug resistance protein
MPARWIGAPCDPTPSRAGARPDRTPPATGGERGRVGLLALLGGLTALGPLTIETSLAALPQVARDLDADALGGQLTLAACVLGLGVGQLVFGVASDRRGRRRPLLVGLALLVAGSLAAAAAPGLAPLILARLLQGLGAAAGIVVARAVVSDLWPAAAAARVFSRLTLVSGLAMIVAPIAGGVLLNVVPWRGVFVAVALAGALLALAGAWLLPETWRPGGPPRRADGHGAPPSRAAPPGRGAPPIRGAPPGRGAAAGIRSAAAALAAPLPDRVYMGFALAGGLGTGGLFAWIAVSPFLLQDVHGFSAQGYAAAFSAFAFAYVAAGQLNAAFVERAGPRRLLLVAVAASGGGSVALLAVALGAGGSVAAVLAAVALAVLPLSAVTPNATALALARRPQDSGAAAGLVGVLPLAIGAVAAPVAGAGGAEIAVSTALVLLVLALGGLVAVLALTRP